MRGGEDNDHPIDEWPAANARKITATRVASIVQYEHKTEDGIENLVATRWGARHTDYNSGAHSGSSGYLEREADTFQVRYGRSHCYDLGNDS